MNSRYAQTDIEMVEFKRIDTTETPAVTYLIELITGAGRTTSLRSFVNPSIVNMYHDDKDLDTVMRMTTQRGLILDATASMKRTMQLIVDEINKKHLHYNFQTVHISSPNSDTNPDSATSDIVIRAEVVSISDLVNDQSKFKTITATDYLYKRSHLKVLDALTRSVNKPVTIQEVISFESTQIKANNYIGRVYPRVSAPAGSMVMQTYISESVFRANNGALNVMIPKIIAEANASKLVKEPLSLSKIVQSTYQETDEGTFVFVIVEVFYK
jgi:hypothetical protein